jgi:hypothetical protein
VPVANISILNNRPVDVVIHTLQTVNGLHYVQSSMEKLHVWVEYQGAVEVAIM